MNTDEYEISLHRELAVCKNTIQRIKESLGLLERKHNKTTEKFIDELRSNKLPDTAEFQNDYDAWRSSYESLKQWEELQQRYQEMFRMMKV